MPQPSSCCGQPVISLSPWACLPSSGISSGRQQVEQALREKEEHISATFDQTAVGIAEFLPDGRIVRHNAKYGEILGCPGDDLQSGVHLGPDHAG